MEKGRTKNEHSIENIFVYVFFRLIVVVRPLLPFGPETNLMGKAYQSIDQAITYSVSLPQHRFAKCRYSGERLSIYRIT
ncbi:hypothetical protein D7V94_11250 [Parablautia intestinalis]|uniref:Uncharacterized protein n=1 Tax=Parablautia intestinalis TaxID=2320100 RepID=A0A3A9AHH9_9FIRM|nr:hypothetical protein D7V94_11250 [Parablautia intestinalis]